MSANPDEQAERLARLRSALEAAFAPQSLTIRDDSAAHIGHAGAREGGHYQVTIVATAFAGRSVLERHRLVYAALSALMGHGVHALSIDARAPSEQHHLQNVTN
ncbi:MAG TPA: BolA family protein [Steroidobacteraceae bacterium]|jgi:BolA protein|nr:BolA family protein [Steroidobacteraceae bacterium]HNS27968.1 BolA family protein [Steroidobacteraceae bacterium]